MYSLEDQFKLIADPTKCIKPKQPSIKNKDKLYIEKFLYYKYKLTHDTMPNEIITTIISEIDKIIQNYQLQQFVSQFVDTCIHNAIEKLKFDIFIEELS